MGRRRNKRVYVQILKLVGEGHTAKRISELLKASLQNIYNKLRKLEKEGLIKINRNAFPSILELTPKGKVWLKRATLNEISDRERQSRKPSSKIRVHNLQVVIPILKRGKGLPVEKRVPINNWVRKILNVRLPFPVTIEETTKSVRVYVHEFFLPRTSKDYMKAFEYLHKVIVTVNSFFIQHGWILDLLGLKVINQEIANIMPEIKDASLSPAKVKFGRKAKGLNGKDMEQRAKAWIDFSPGKGIPEVETNDSVYETRFLMMPEHLEQISKNIEDIGKFARSHEGLITTITTKTLPELNEMLKKINSRLGEL